MTSTSMADRSNPKRCAASQTAACRSSSSGIRGSRTDCTCTSSRRRLTTQRRPVNPPEANAPRSWSVSEPRSTTPAVAGTATIPAPTTRSWWRLSRS